MFLISPDITLPSSWPAAPREEINLDFFVWEFRTFYQSLQFSCWRHFIFVTMLVTDLVTALVSFSQLLLTLDIRHQNIKTCHFLGFIAANPSNLTSWGRWSGIVLYCDWINNLIKTWGWLTERTELILAIFQVRYTGYRDRPIHERQNKFLNAARDGSTEIVSTIFIILTIKIELKSPVTSPPDFSNKLL